MNEMRSVPARKAAEKNLNDTTFWPAESHGTFEFRWTHRVFEIANPNDEFAFISLQVASPKANLLNIELGQNIHSIALRAGWQTIEVATLGAPLLSFTVQETLTPGNGDERDLGLMFRDAVFHNDRDRFNTLSARHNNALLNSQEFQEGVTELRSAPIRLRITCSKTCNIANESACTYCAWNFTKSLEVGSPDQNIDFLTSLGRYADLPLQINDCSYGEPPLEPNFAKIVSFATAHDRMFEFTSNGQTLSRKKRDALLGKPVRLHVSIDSVTAEGYRRYRDHRFELVMKNVEELCAERTQFGGMPEVFVSFILMRSNVDEIEPYLHRMSEIGVDNVTFRALYLEEEQDQDVGVHYGYLFDYEAEILTPDELDAAGQKCTSLGNELGVNVTIEWDAFTQNEGPQTEDEPLCAEPWKAAYVLARGIMPCCYGREPIVKWKDVALNVDRETAIKEALNAEPFKELRSDLAQGRLGSYCKKCPSCPIVKRVIDI